MSSNSSERGQLAALAKTVLSAPAWFAGADLRVLARASSERAFYTALGTLVLLLSAASGVAVTLAAGFWLGTSAARLWPLGLVWAGLIATTERLLLQVPSTRKRLLPIILIPRLALSLLIAVQLGEPLVLRVFDAEINDRLSVVATNRVHESLRAAGRVYDPRIKADRVEAAAIGSRENQLVQRLEKLRFLSACERSEASCSHTGKLGCGTYCHHYARLAGAAASQLAAMKSGDRARLDALTTDIERLRAARNQELASRQRAITNDRGLLAREAALNQIMAATPGVRAIVWFLRLLFVTFDLLPISAKVLRMLSIESPYEAIAEEDREQDMLHAYRLNATTRVEKQRIALFAKRDMTVDIARIDAETDRLLADLVREWASSAGAPAEDPYSPSQPDVGDPALKLALVNDDVRGES